MKVYCRTCKYYFQDDYFFTAPDRRREHNCNKRIPTGEWVPEKRTAIECLPAYEKFKLLGSPLVINADNDCRYFKEKHGKNI